MAERGSDAARRLLHVVREKLALPPSPDGSRDGSDEIAPLSLTPEAINRMHTLIRTDAGWAQSLESAWAQVRPEIQVHGTGVTNTIRGDVRGTVIQARDIDGGISLG